MADDLLSVLFGGLLAILGGFFAQVYQAHRNDLAAKRVAHTNVSKLCMAGTVDAINWVKRLNLSGTADKQFLTEIKTRCSDLYNRTQENLGSAGDSITGPLQKKVEDYCDILYEISWKDYGSQSLGPLTTDMFLRLKADLGRMQVTGDHANIDLNIERSALVDLRWLRRHFRS